MDLVEIASTAAAASQTAQATRNAGDALDSLLLTSKLTDDTLRTDVKQFAEDIDALQSLLGRLANAKTQRSDEHIGIYAKLRTTLSICAATLDQLAQHARNAEKAKSGIFKQGRKLTAKDEVVIRAKQRVPVHSSAIQLTLAIFNV